MAYNYYQNSAPGWGTSQLQFGAPPTPAFRPQAGWGGLDYFRAHAVNPDPNLYYSTMTRMRDFGGAGGVGMHEARHWHRRVYGGLMNPGELLPTDIGSAAAYEAYRTWKYHRPMLYDPIGVDQERMREALVSMAVAEATRLWQFSGHSLDAYGLRAAAEAAALTAQRIAMRVIRSENMSMGGGGGMGMGGMAGSAYGGMNGGVGGMGGGMNGGVGGMGGGMNGRVGGMGGGMGMGAGGAYGGRLSPFEYDDGAYLNAPGGRMRRYSSTIVDEPPAAMRGSPYAGGGGGGGGIYAGGGASPYAGGGAGMPIPGAGVGYAGSGASTGSGAYGAGMPGSYPGSYGGGLGGGGTYGGAAGTGVNGVPGIGMSGGLAGSALGGSSGYGGIMGGGATVPYTYGGGAGATVLPQAGGYGTGTGGFGGYGGYGTTQAVPQGSTVIIRQPRHHHHRHHRAHSVGRY